MALTALLILTLGASLIQQPGTTIAPNSWEGADLSGLGSNYISAQTLHTNTFFLPLIANQRQAPVFGVQIYFNMATNPTALQRMTGLPVTWVRLPVYWESIEPNDTTPEQYNWTFYDNQFMAASASGFQVIATISNNPPWASGTDGGPVYPERQNDFLEFIAALVERYDGDGVDDAPGSPKVLHWEFYNEPDNTSLFSGPGFGQWGYIGDEYAAMLGQVYPVIKAASSSARVVMGGIAYDNFIDEGLGSFNRAFVDDFFNAGGGNYIDYFNFHYYPAFAHKWNPYGSDLIGKTNFLKNKMVSYGINKPVIITEIGMPSNATSGGSDELQSRYIVKAYSRAMAANVEVLVWFLLNDNPPLYIFGLTDANFAPKPSYTAYQRAATHLSGADYKRTLSAAELGHSQSEGYFFQQEQYAFYVVWTNDDAAAQIRIQANAVSKVDKYGSVSVIQDGSDGVVDGFVTVSYDGSPVYLVLIP